MIKKLSELGARARIEIGEASDKALLEKARQHAGLTIYELSKELGWTKGRVQGSVNRLLELNLIRKKKVVLNDRILTKIFPADYKEPETGIVEVEYNVIDPKLWKNHAFAFAGAMNRVLIKIVPEQLSSALTDKAFLVEKVPIEQKEDRITLKIPEKLRDFYILDNSILGVSTTDKGDAILVTIEGTIAEMDSKY
jgi:DNA-binding Lrp family transcriptional regulator